MAKRKRRFFTPAFKTDAVRLVTTGARTVAQVVHDLDLTESALRDWIRQAQVDAGTGEAGALTTAEKAELTHLRRENKVLRMERDLLKKAAAFFAREST